VVGQCCEPGLCPGTQLGLVHLARCPALGLHTLQELQLAPRPACLSPALWCSPTWGPLQLGAPLAEGRQPQVPGVHVGALMRGLPLLLACHCGCACGHHQTLQRPPQLAQLVAQGLVWVRPADQPPLTLWQVQGRAGHLQMLPPDAPGLAAAGLLRALLPEPPSSPAHSASWS
jgi:hypothetical protein